jgi:hypothetical protein
MLCTPHLPFTLIQNLLQISHGLSRQMISFRMFYLMFIIGTTISAIVVLFPLHSYDCISCIRYADNPNAYWTGYYTSRPALKQYIRMMSGYYLVVLPLFPYVVFQISKKPYNIVLVTW